MKKSILFFMIVMVISFLTPNLFLLDIMAANKGKSDYQNGSQDLTSNSNENVAEKGFDRKTDFPETIKLLLTEKNEVIELPFEDYIKGVLIGEVPITYELEALKAQAIVARTYTLNKMKTNPNVHPNADMCDDINCCQAYKTKEYAFASWDDEEENEKWRKLETAVESTSDRVITYQGSLIAAFFHANSGGQTENAKYVWGGEDIPYLQSVAGNEGDIYQDTKSFTKAEFAELIQGAVSDYEKKDYPIEIVDYTGSGRVYHLKIGETTLKATDLRRMLGIRSTNFRVEKDENGNITFYTIGYGHGVGMSQEGANQMALEGATCEEIIKHYYLGVEC
ncbi:MAG: stage II sporulation protein D [Clostridia bacterium]|nr:stage II sporulation protein D [Clostridia bacterium]